METLLEEKTETLQDTSRDDDLPRSEEISELLRIKHQHHIEEYQVPCPACGVAVSTRINQCPFCESDITAETALARETNRRLKELSGELDTQHAARTTEKPRPRNFFQRLAAVFTGDPVPTTPVIEPFAVRHPQNAMPGDTLKILGQDGMWLQVKNQAGDIGWLFCTIRKRP
ncbi:MAG TPA: hypothetical protein VFH88_06675 [Candidatus Krumholzibacteria bacterium]|nr:hypothetical protein [Candidatus Krumholzibacteria bacterium]